MIMADWLNSAQDAAMKAVSVPPMTAGFADRVIAALPAALDPLPTARPARDRRGLWGGWRKRASIGLIAVTGAGLVSMAAASTLFGVPIRNMPVVGTFVEQVAPKPKPTTQLVKPKAKQQDQALRLAPVAKPVVVEMPMELRPPVISRKDLQREVVAQRIADHIAKVQAKRRELGLPPGRPKLTPRMRERLEAMSPEERRALVKRVGELRIDQGPLGAQLTPEERAARKAIWEQMTPEQRQAIRQKRREQLRKRMEERAVETAPMTEKPVVTLPPADPQ
jgi:hypothetical protein